MNEDSPFAQGLLRLHKRDLNIRDVSDETLNELCEPMLKEGLSLRECLIRIKRDIKSRESE